MHFLCRDDFANRSDFPETDMISVWCSHSCWNSDKIVFFHTWPRCVGTSSA